VEKTRLPYWAVTLIRSGDGPRVSEARMVAFSVTKEIVLLVNALEMGMCIVNMHVSV
jgi:hypothetical protein